MPGHAVAARARTRRGGCAAITCQCCHGLAFRLSTRVAPAGVAAAADVADLELTVAPDGFLDDRQHRQVLAAAAPAFDVDEEALADRHRLLTHRRRQRRHQLAHRPLRRARQPQVAQDARRLRHQQGAQFLLLQPRHARLPALGQLPAALRRRAARRPARPPRSAPPCRDGPSAPTPPAAAQARRPVRRPWPCRSIKADSSRSAFIAPRSEGPRLPLAGRPPGFSCAPCSPANYDAGCHISAITLISFASTPDSRQIRAFSSHTKEEQWPQRERR